MLGFNVKSVGLSIDIQGCSTTNHGKLFLTKSHNPEILEV